MAKFALLGSLLMIAGGVAYLAISRVPAPTQAVEKPISLERFFQ